MGLETGTWTDDLVVTNPPGGDSKSQGDDHLRLIKTVIRNTFKRASKAFSFPGTISKTANYTVLSTDDNLTVLCDTTAGDFTLTLPVLASGDAGWAIFVIKSSGDSNAVFLQPASGTISGLAKVRRSILNGMTRVTWTGGAYHATRPNGGIIGSSVPFHGTALPAGHLWPDGGAVNSTLFPELFAAIGGTKPDLRGRGPFGRDDMGGVATNRITAGQSGIAGTTLGASGGTEVHTLSIGQVAAHNHTGATGLMSADHTHSGTTGTESVAHSHGFSGTTTGQSADHTHTYVPSPAGGAFQAGGTAGAQNPTGSNSTGGASNDHTHNYSGNTGTESALHNHGFTTGGVSANHNHSISFEGGGGAHQNMPPALICNFILVAE